MSEKTREQIVLEILVDITALVLSRPENEPKTREAVITAATKYYEAYKITEDECHRVLDMTVGHWIGTPDRVFMVTPVWRSFWLCPNCGNNLGYAVDNDHRRIREVEAKPLAYPPPPREPRACTCDTHALMREGCKCGGS